jgi:hypothetical protein
MRRLAVKYPKQHLVVHSYYSHRGPLQWSKNNCQLPHSLATVLTSTQTNRGRATLNLQSQVAIWQFSHVLKWDMPPQYKKEKERTGGGVPPPALFTNWPNTIFMLKEQVSVFFATAIVSNSCFGSSQVLLKHFWHIIMSQLLQ